VPSGQHSALEEGHLHDGWVGVVESLHADVGHNDDGGDDGIGVGEVQIAHGLALREIGEQASEEGHHAVKRPALQVFFFAHLANPRWFTVALALAPVGDEIVDHEVGDRVEEAEAEGGACRSLPAPGLEEFPRLAITGLDLLQHMSSGLRKFLGLGTTSNDSGLVDPEIRWCGVRHERHRRRREVPIGLVRWRREEGDR